MVRSCPCNKVGFFNFSSNCIKRVNITETEKEVRDGLYLKNKISAVKNRFINYSFVLIIPNYIMPDLLPCKMITEFRPPLHSLFIYKQRAQEP